MHLRMSDILDQDYIYEYGELNIDANGSGLLSVDQLAWREELYKLERLRNGGCLIGVIILIFLMILPIPGGGYLLGFGVLVAYQIWNSGTIIYSNLLNHGQYRYEVQEGKIVRYSKGKYLKFEFEEIKKAKIKKYGIVLFKHVDINSYLLKDTRKDLLVIPNKTQGYDQIVKYLIAKKILKEKSNSQ